MKKFVPLFILPCIFAACSKDSVNPVIPPETHASIITSVSSSDATHHRLLIDSFEYDANSRLKNYYRISYDSSTTPVQMYSGKYAFTYDGNDSLPVSFTGGNYVHILAYNDEHKIIKDSVDGLYTYYFNYGDNVIYTSLMLLPSIGYYQDTISLQNGNMVSSEYWFFMPSGTQHTSSSTTFSSLANPLHNLSGMGLLLYTLGGTNWDYVSANLVSAGSSNGNPFQTNTWVSSGGQVTGGVESFGGQEVAVSFRYK